jgi:hypothetical protein
MPRQKKQSTEPTREQKDAIIEQVTQGGIYDGTETEARKEAEARVRVETIYYHVNIGKNQWREAVLCVEVGASPESLAKAAETVNALNAAFPLPAAGGINTWYNDNFVYACIAISSYTRLVKMLVSMAEVMVANPGEVIVGWGKQFANATIAEVADNPDGPSYMKWISEQQGTDVIRIQAAYEAYQIARGAKVTT